MEIPSRVSVFNQILEIKGSPGTLIAVGANGYYEVQLEVRGRVHTVLFPITETVIVFNEPVTQATVGAEVER
ncbi:MAG: hypothetical protein WBX15_16940 [Thermoanaerobaculia bacterium]